MNQKGFGLKEFIIIISVIFVSMLIALSLTQTLVDNDASTKTIDEKTTYQDLENKLEKAAERYQNDTYSSKAGEVEKWALSYSMLKDKGYLEPIYDLKDKKIECNGYVEFLQDGIQISYKPYLKCGNNYKTKGYDGNLVIENVKNK